MPPHKGRWSPYPEDGLQDTMYGLSTLMGQYLPGFQVPLAIPDAQIQAQYPERGAAIP